MPHIAQLGLCLLFLAGLGLFVYNMFLARQGWTGMKYAQAQKAAMEAEFSGMRGKVARSERLRSDLKVRFGAQYASVVEPVDQLMAQASSMLMAGQSSLAMDLIDEANLEMENLLRTSAA